MDGACSRHERDKIRIQIVFRKPGRRIQLEVPLIDGRIILKWILAKRDMRLWT
jgi:hypothetical protein